MNKSGVVSYVSMRNIKGQDLHSFALKGTDGFFSCGTTDPKLNKGEFINFEAEQKQDGNFLANVSSIVKSFEGGSEITGKPVPSYSKGSYKTQVSNSKDQYWTDREARDIITQQTIQLQASRNAAIALASVILQAGACPGYAKAKESDKITVITGLVDHLTDKFQSQVADSKNPSKNAEEATVATDAAEAAGSKWE